MNLCQDGLLSLHRGMKGVAFTDALDKRDVCPTIPEYGTPEYDSGPLDRLHASIPALLSSAATQELLEGAEPASEAQLVRNTQGPHDSLLSTAPVVVMNCLCASVKV